MKMQWSIVRQTVLSAMALVSVFCLAAGVAGGAEAIRVKEDAEQTVGVETETQVIHENWTEEKQALMEEMDEIRARLQRIEWQRQKTETYKATLEKKIRDLKLRASEMETVALELLPVLEDTLEKLSVFIDGDIPFETAERKKRLHQAETVLDDYDMGLLPKTHAVFDALSREVDIGYTVAVREGEIVVDGQARQVKLLRVGRIGLYALTLDTGSAFVWDAGTRRFEALEKSDVHDVLKAVQMAEGTRIIELVRLPVAPGVSERVSGGDHVSEN